MLVISISPDSQKSLMEIKGTLEQAGFRVETYRNFNKIFEVDAKDIKDLPQHIQKHLRISADADMEIGIDAVQTIDMNDNWGLGRIDKKDNPYRVDKTTTYTYERDGSGVKAFVIDTGIDSDHSEFGSRAITVYGGEDQHGHGTHVGTTIAGNRYGVAKNPKVYGLNVLGQNGRGTLRNILMGIDHVIQQHKDTNTPSVANMSLGGRVRSMDNPLNDGVDEMIRNGIVVVVAAGNDGADLDDSSIYTPAEIRKAITVGAVDKNDDVAYFSNYGQVVDTFAPGVDITAGTPNNQTATYSGTSMASPHVAGIVCQMLQDREKFTSADEVEQFNKELVGHTVQNAIKLNESKYSKTPNRMTYMGFLNEHKSDEEREQDSLFRDLTADLDQIGSLAGQMTHKVHDAQELSESTEAKQSMGEVGSLTGKMPHVVHSAQNTLEKLRRKNK